jgi:hypothetical protein
MSKDDRAAREKKALDRINKEAAKKRKELKEAKEKIDEHDRKRRA